MGTLDGKVAVVTGGASGIGLAAARRFHREGAEVVIVDLDEAGARRSASELGGGAVAADVGDPASWPRIVAAAEALGGIDVAFLNAGTAIGRDDLAALEDDEYRRITSVNLDGVVFGVRAVLPALRRRGGGAIVATSSMAGLIPFPGDPVYTATKHAVVGLVRALASGLREQGITVNAVCPSLVDTPLIDGEVREVLAGAGFPMVTAEQVADAVHDCVVGTASGKAIVVQVGLEPTAHRFAPTPAPNDTRAADAVPDAWKP